MCSPPLPGRPVTVTSSPGFTLSLVHPARRILSGGSISKCHSSVLLSFFTASQRMAWGLFHSNFVTIPWSVMFLWSYCTCPWWANAGPEAARPTTTTTTEIIRPVITKHLRTASSSLLRERRVVSSVVQIFLPLHIGRPPRQTSAFSEAIHKQSSGRQPRCQTTAGWKSVPQRERRAARLDRCPTCRRFYTQRNETPGR